MSKSNLLVSQRMRILIQVLCPEFCPFIDKAAAALAGSWEGGGGRVTSVIRLREAESGAGAGQSLKWFC